MPEYLIKKLENFELLSATDKTALSMIADGPLRKFRRGEDVCCEGDAPLVVRIFISGWAYRYKFLHDGRRQILSFLLPGDFCDLNGFAVRSLDHSVAAATKLAVAEIPQTKVLELIHRNPQVHRALCWDQQLSIAMLRESVLNMQRTALERVAYVLCMLCFRLELIGLANSGSFDFPLTQSDLASAIGLSTVHVNRTFQKLRSLRLISLSDRHLLINDLQRLQTLAMFTPTPFAAGAPRTRSAVEVGDVHRSHQPEAALPVR